MKILNCGQLGFKYGFHIHYSPDYWQVSLKRPINILSNGKISRILAWEIEY